MGDQIQNNNMITMRPPKIKNKAANPIQITAEQLLQRAFLDRKKPFVEPDYRIRDEGDLNEIKQRKRKEFENKIRQQRFHMGHWIKYAIFEEGLQEFRRARSAYERALEVDYKNISLWLKYIEMEMRHKFINHARNVFERAIELLPRVDQFWYKYAYMEEMIANYVAARNIFQRWMEWRPEEKAWLAYLAFEQPIWMLFQDSKHTQRSLNLKQSLAYKQDARQLFEKTLEELGQEALKEEYFINFAKFEIRNQEYDRAREIFKFGLENIPKEKSKKLYEEYLSFEKQHGTKDDIDELIFNERRLHYKLLIAENKMNYDAWFDLVNLEIATGNNDRTRDTFEHAVKNVPLAHEKRLWRRYIYLWYNYATFEEIEANDPLKAKEVYERALKLVPHSKFTFSKLWVMYAHFQVRHENLEAARKIFGTAIGKCPNDKLFREYIDIEYKLANIDRVRKIYEKYIEVFPDNPDPFIQWAQLEKSLPELERYRAIFDLAINRPTMNMPEKVWKAYIDNEIELEENENVRNLFEELLKRSKNVKIWLSYASFEAKVDDREKCRAVYTRAEEHFKAEKLKEERALILESWRKTELQFGDAQFISQINAKQPQRVKKERKIVIAEGDIEEEAGKEEYYDYIFPGEEEGQNLTKLIQKAKQKALEKKLKEQAENPQIE
ncbi:hypothetical protein ABPG72_011115 [Tetrahymena utriculariae]